MKKFLLLGLPCILGLGILLALRSPRTTISGTLQESDAKTVYLNEIDHFDYFNNAWALDSTIVAEDGSFTFKSLDLSGKLVSLTTTKFQPFTYQIFTKNPEHYFFGNCEMYFTAIPTLYITDEANINLNWTETRTIDVISSPDQSGALQEKMRSYYLNAKKVEGSKVDYDNKVDHKTNWAEMLKERNFDLENANLKNIDQEATFDNYLYTEIYLLHLNNFLNWYEEHFTEEVNAALQAPKADDFYANIFSGYNNHDWNSKSLEYYKFTERYVNYHMNLQSKSFQNYYTPTPQKRKLAEQVLRGKNKERYLNLLDKQLKNVMQ